MKWHCADSMYSTHVIYMMMMWQDTIVAAGAADND